ncbi:hypothetical protein KC19_3G163900 [Ceratodon purpureus]|uniref:Uncharacterized protein n=1 Tax=Ceratodon purpureus TaxID=3225 RepID=A0A8T0ILK4_CERPU|nr:hypothetical protein KC19_3G163900 [Ceratodon purpureus]
MASAGVAAAAAVSSGVHICESGSRVSTSSVSLKALSLGRVRCSPRVLAVNQVQVFGSRQGVSDIVRKSQPIRAQAVANDLATGKEPSSPATSQKTTYYYLIANAKFMLDDEEHFQEQMQEKLRMYGERKKEQDFWIVIEPEFLDKHPEVAKRVSRPAVALVSTDKVWITFMKLRLDRVLKGEISVDSPKEALTGKLTAVKFEKPEKWIAVYPKYEGDWWTPFLYKEN